MVDVYTMRNVVENAHSSKLLEGEASMFGWEFETLIVVVTKNVKKIPLAMTNLTK